MNDDRPWHRHNVPADRELRARQTPAEQVLWAALRERRLAGLKFRQHPIGPFVADFCCPDHRLIIELDGGVHDTQREHDAERDQLLTAEGYQIVRFPNDRVLTELPAVLAAIRAAADQAHPSFPANTPRTGAL